MFDKTEINEKEVEDGPFKKQLMKKETNLTHVESDSKLPATISSRSLILPKRVL